MPISSTLVLVLAAAAVVSAATVSSEPRRLYLPRTATKVGGVVAGNTPPRPAPSDTYYGAYTNLNMQRDGSFVYQVSAMGCVPTQIVIVCACVSFANIGLRQSRSSIVPCVVNADDCAVDECRAVSSR